MMETAVPVRMGLWTNHQQSILRRSQYTTSDPLNTYLQLFLGVCLGAATPLLSDILTRLGQWLKYSFFHRDSSHSVILEAQTGQLDRSRPASQTLPDGDAPHENPPVQETANEATPLLNKNTPLSASSETGTPVAGPTLNHCSTSNYGTEPPNHPVGRPNSSTTTPPDNTLTPCHETATPSNDTIASIEISAVEPTNPEQQPFLDNRSDISANESTATTANDEKSSRRWLSMIFSFTFLLFCIACAVAWSFATTIPADTCGLSASSHCGAWSLREDAGKEAMDKDDFFQAEKETRSGQYGRDCYNRKSIISPDRCNFFNKQAIPYEKSKHDIPCPFKDKTFCVGGGYSAVQFSTGLVESTFLGINSQRPPRFNRTTMCVPLNMDQGFIKEIAPNESHRNYQYEYNLGPVGDSEYQSNYTFWMYGDPFEWDVPAYAVSAYEATPYPKHNYWTPRPELEVMHPGKNYLTLLFISSCRIIYTGPSKDYIFHAADEYPHRTDRYWNADPRARPLACIDWTEVCTYDGKCAHMDEEHAEYGPQYEFTRSALRKSTTFRSIQFRLGTALVAQESVGDYESLPLSSTQWIIEAEAMFQTSLARAQFDALDIATGLRHDKRSYELENPTWAQDKLCGFYTFKLPKGYTNVNIVATIGISLILPVLYALSYQTSVEFEEEKKSAFDGNWMVFDYVIATLWSSGHTLMERLKAWMRSSRRPST